MQPKPNVYARALVWPALFLFLACAGTGPAGGPQTPAAVKTPSGLAYRVVHPGTGPVAQAGDKALIHETTRLKDGTVVTDTWKLNFPIPFVLGGNQVIDGLDEAVTGMRVGERRHLVVPPALSKRSVYPDSISPQDTLYYDVILLQVTKP